MSQEDTETTHWYMVMMGLERLSNHATWRFMWSFFWKFAILQVVAMLWIAFFAWLFEG